jgi:hypothetical protein
MVEDSIKLLQLQTQLEKDLKETFVGLSISQTIYKCIILGQSTKASKVKTDFKVPEKRLVGLGFPSP